MILLLLISKTFPNIPHMGSNYLLRAYFRYGVCVTTHTKELRAHLTNSVEPFQSSWTNGKQFAYISTV